MYTGIYRYLKERLSYPMFSFYCMGGDFSHWSSFSWKRKKEKKIKLTKRRRADRQISTST